MSKDDDDWEFEASEAIQAPALSEFTRYKLELKRKAGLFDPWYVKLFKRLRHSLTRFYK